MQTPPENAAKKYAEQRDWSNADWSDREQTVYVETDEGMLKYTVTMEMIPEYTARLEKQE